jgi:hypothetical protein
METITDEQFQRLLEGVDHSTGLGLFDSYFDPTLLPGNGGEDRSYLCFPPLPPIQEEAPPISDIPSLEEDESVYSIATSLPEEDEALAMVPWKRLLDQQRAQQEKLKIE